jgi:hypothetical protein
MLGERVMLGRMEKVVQSSITPCRMARQTETYKLFSAAIFPFNIFTPYWTTGKEIFGM